MQRSRSGEQFLEGRLVEDRGVKRLGLLALGASLFTGEHVVGVL